MNLPRIGPEHALFLDIDGTLIDLAATPDAVVVPPELPGVLRRLRARLGGAVAVISGRKLDDVDRLIGPDFAAAAEHGAILRGADGKMTIHVKRPAAYAEWLRELNEAAGEMPGVLVEVKAFNLVLHYRQAPQYEAALRGLAERLVAGSDDAVLLPAHCAFEVKARGADKGEALATFMLQQPFIDRIPIFVGDDATDEAAIARADASGGIGLHVAREFSGAPQAVRDWLKQNVTQA